MKKFISIFIVLAVAATVVFAEKKATVKVESVVGKVSYEISNGVWNDLKDGMTIDFDSNVSTGLNSTLTVLVDGKSVTIKPMKKGKITDLAIASNSSSKTGVKIGSKITEADIAQAAEKSTKAVSTASSRASEAKADVEWDE